MKIFLRRIRAFLQISILRIVSISAFTSSLYYFILSSAFRREHLAVVKGRLKYYHQNEVEKEAFYLLRRNIHRIEKGLIMKPRRPVFALEYIEETVGSYVKIMTGPKKEISEKNLKWYSDVLNHYFEVVDIKNPKINSSKLIFEKYKYDLDVEKASIPYKRNFETLKVSYEDFLGLAKLRRAVRWYEDKPVSRELIDKAIKAASLSPSACNRQPFEFRVFDDKELVQKVANISWGTLGFSHNFPVIVVVVGSLEAYFDERDRHVIYIDGALASMSFMYALETLGLSSCPINWPDVKKFENQMGSLLGLEKNERPIMLISLGHPDKDALVPFSEKKDLFELRSYNKTKN
ncbi:nitroreductase [Flagellimonas olearia]|uniref:Nitroreductase n=1 Tax=Flagellimonas olearia TaxID=552546 RepID=A0A6I1DUX4_9FLAO|nr:nitroreductase family protein [Allomuricauda olearia]KAB7528665.1 nitroreductase [Allomuricauda olearia]